MSKVTILLCAISIVLVCNCSSPPEQKLLYDATKVGRFKELVFHETPLRGTESDEGIVYYVEDDVKNPSAYKEAALWWRVDIIAACGKPGVGAPEIRHIAIRNDTIGVTYGKHSYAVVDRSTGTATF